MVRPSKPFDLYVRVSRVRGREHLISPAEQERRARQLARERGLKIGKVLTDLDESGGKLERPGLQEALERVRQARSGGLIVAWLDRLSRDSEQAHRLVRELHEAGGTVYAPDAPADWTAPEGELQAGIVFAFAQYVRNRARAGFERSKEQSIAAGVPIANRCPVGYRRRDDRRLEPDPKTAPIISELFERRAAGEGPSALADFLRSKRVKTSQGSSFWSKPAVAHILKSRVYLGELSYGKDRRFVNAAAHEPIVDVATWTAAQHPRGRRLQPPRGAGRYTLTGLLRCQACGYAMQGTTTSRGKRIYRCIRRHAGGTCPQPIRVPADVVERAAEDAFWAVTKDRVARGRADKTDPLPELAAGLERAQQRLTQALSPAMQDAAGEQWAELVRARRDERDQAAEALGHARAEQANVASRVTVATLRKTWPKLTPVERRELLAARFDAVVLRRGSGGIELATFLTGSLDVESLSRRGFRRVPELRPIDVPTDAWIMPLEHPNERRVDAAV